MAVCYRHPGRETKVACSNCGRPICPDCMTPTPVGMRCPECAGQTTPVKRIGTGLAAGRAPATYALIAINVAFFFAEVAGGGGGFGFNGGGSVYNNLALFGPKVADGEWYRVVTGGFLHAGLLHIAFNMFALFILGRLLEPAIGTPRFLGIYGVALLAGSCGALIVTPDALTVGASGAIFGLMSAAFIIARHRGLEQIAGQIGLFVLINLAFTFGAAGISVGGHIGGLIGGGLAALIVAFGERGRVGGVAEGFGMLALAAAAFAGCLVAASAA
jgi:membrane associated rhomboid family serine protease